MQRNSKLKWNFKWQWMQGHFLQIFFFLVEIRVGCWKTFFKEVSTEWVVRTKVQCGVVSLEKPQLPCVIQHTAVFCGCKQVSGCPISPPQHCMGFFDKPPSSEAASPGTGALGCLWQVTGPAAGPSSAAPQHHHTQPRACCPQPALLLEGTHGRNGWSNVKQKNATRTPKSQKKCIIIHWEHASLLLC